MESSLLFQDESQMSQSTGGEEEHVRSKSHKSSASASISDDGQRTTELLELDMADKSLSLRGPDGCPNLEEDEKVEMPRSSRHVAPGICFLGGEAPGLMSSESLMLRELLQSQHDDIMIRFDHQQEMLKNLFTTQTGRHNRGSSDRSSSRSSWVPSEAKESRERRHSITSSMHSVPSSPTRRERRTSVRKQPSPPKLNGDVGNVGVTSGGLLVRVDSPQAKHRPAKLFSSLTRVDEELRQKAADVDAEQAKAQRKDTQDSVESGTHFFKVLVQNPWFDFFFAIAILTNAVFIGFEVEAVISKADDDFLLMLSILGKCYAALFFVELVIRILAQRASFVSMNNPEFRWNMMDVIIVVASLVELALEISSLISDGEELQLTGMSGLRTLRIIRITRLVKIARLAKILRFIMALRTLTQSIMHTLKSLIWAVVLLLLIVYTFAVLFTQVVNDYMNEGENISEEEAELGKRYFSSLPKAMLSLYMCIANGVSWEQVIIPLNAVSVVWDFAFLFYIAFATLAVLNVITGVFCQSAIDSAQSDHEMVIQSIVNNKDAHCEKIRMLFSEIDEDESGVITYQMFEKGIRSEEVKTYFESIDLDVWDAWTFFKLLDMDSGGAVEIEEFLLGCLRLRGNAKAMDIAKLCHDQTWLIREQARFWEFVEEELNHLHSVHMKLARNSIH